MVSAALWFFDSLIFCSGALIGYISSFHSFSSFFTSWEAWCWCSDKSLFSFLRRWDFFWDSFVILPDEGETRNVVTFDRLRKIAFVDYSRDSWNFNETERDNVVCAVPRYRTNVLCSSVLACAARTERWCAWLGSVVRGGPRSPARKSEGNSCTTRTVYTDDGWWLSLTINNDGVKLGGIVAVRCFALEWQYTTRGEKGIWSGTWKYGGAAPRSVLLHTTRAPRRVL